MSEFPPPPIDAEVDLTDFSFMPLDVRRLRDSKLAASADGEAFRCSVLLWCAAWHQLPAGSLPDDNVELATLAGFGRMVAQWKKVRAGALYGWEKCSDGRLYHSVVVEKANESWQSKLDLKYRRECDRLRKENKRRSENHEVALKIPSFEEWNSARRAHGIPADKPGFPADVPRKSSGDPPDSLLKGQGIEQKGQGRESESPPEDARPPETGDGAPAKPPDDEGGPTPRGDAGLPPVVPLPTAVVIDSFPYEQAIMADFPSGPDLPNPANWTAAIHNAHQLVSNGLATWPELVAAVRRYAAYWASNSAMVNVAAHNFFDRRKGNHWQQEWKPTATKAEKRLEGNLAAAAEAKRQLFGSTG